MSAVGTQLARGSDVADRLQGVARRGPKRRVRMCHDSLRRSGV